MTKHPPHVMVQFNNGAHSFLLPAGATLMELADENRRSCGNPQLRADRN